MFVLPSFFLACQNHPEVLKNIFYYFEIFLFWDIFRKKTAFRRKNSHTGGGGGVFPRGNFSHIIPFFYSEDVPNFSVNLLCELLCIQTDVNPSTLNLLKKLFHFSLVGIIIESNDCFVASNGWTI